MNTSERGQLLPFWLVENRFPFLSHRTLAEVDETEKLRAPKAADRHKFINSARAPRLQALEARAYEPDLGREPAA